MSVATPCVRPDFRGRALRGADFIKRDLGEADFSEADLEGARFFRAEITEADFRRARLRGADLRDACFAMSHFEGADMRNANMDGASFEEAYFDSTTRLVGAKVDEVMPFPMFVNGQALTPEAALDWLRQRADDADDDVA